MASSKYPSVRPENGDTRLQANALTDHLSPYQNPRTGSLKDSGLSKEQIIKLLKAGIPLKGA